MMPYNLFKLQDKELRRTLPDSPSFYLARDIKRIGGNEMNKIMFTRLMGHCFLTEDVMQSIIQGTVS